MKIICAILALIMFATVALGQRKKSEPQPPSPLPPEPAEEIYGEVPLDLELLRLDKKALEEAYHAQLLKLFEVWLKGAGGDSQYFQNGLQNARRAYYRAAAAIAAREKQYKLQQERLKKEQEQQQQQENKPP